MKKLLMLIFPIITFFAFAQDDVICHTPSTEKFGMLASNKKFVSSHVTPLEYIHVSQAGGEMVKIKCADGTEANAYLLKAKQNSNNWIFVFQEWWGLNDHIKKQADDLYYDLGNINVLALDMYDGKLATDGTTAGKYMGEFKQDRGDVIVKAALTFAGPKAKVGTIGWCFGGGQSLLASITSGKQSVACVMYYGMPVEDVSVLKTLNSDVLNIWPTQDQWINKAMMDKFTANMQVAGKNLTIKAYDADHAFANPSNPKHNKEFTADAYKNTIEFFKARLSMRKIILSVAVSLDGFIEGPNGEYDWCPPPSKKEMDDFLKGIDIIFMGRKSYEMAGEFMIPEKMTYIFSNKLKQVRGKNVKLLSGDVLKEVETIRKQKGKDIWLWGGANLTTTFLNHNLVDEMWLGVVPVVLGRGTPLFQNIEQRKHFVINSAEKISDKAHQAGYVSLKLSKAKS